MDKETGKEFLIDGQKVTAEQTFKPKNSSGKVEMAFTFDAAGMENKSVVVFETVTFKEKKVAVHADINDEGQTVRIPQIGTTAKDAEDGDQKAFADEKVTLVDKVAYENLEIGRTYKVVGVLMHKKTGKALLVNGKTVTSEAEFVAKDEELLIAAHKDIKDKGQTVKLVGRTFIIC